MNTESIEWSEEKQRRLQEHLVGFFAKDVWIFPLTKLKNRYYRFHFILTSPSLRTEVKYFVWSKLNSGQWKRDGDHRHIASDLKYLMKWLNRFTLPIQSILEKSLEQWELAFRSSLVENGHLRHKRGKRLLSTQVYGEKREEDFRILLLRQLYTTIRDAYDDRPEVEKDVWDMRRMNLALNPTLSHYRLNFTSITQPWLRHLAKAFMKYNSAVHSPGDCVAKLNALIAFSRFLAREDVPVQRTSDIDRALMLSYISYLRDSGRAAAWRRCCLSNLRVVLETCAHRLDMSGLTKERVIFDDDYPQLPEALPRDLPEEVLYQLREHLDALPTDILRMVTVLLECGLRLMEVCTLTLDCLICDDKHEWYLQCYQAKSKKEHIIPLVDDVVIGAIQAQQQEIRARWGKKCPYLFPSRHSVHRPTPRPFQQTTFCDLLNEWAVKSNIKDRNGVLWRFQSHQFRHTVGMRLINEDVSLETISRLFGHNSLTMTQRYARKRKEELRKELERVHRKRKTVDYQGQIVKGDSCANAPEAQLLRKGVRGQTLPVGGCRRLVVLGGCPHANSCVTCTFWLTSTDDLPALRSFYERAVRLRKLAAERGNAVVLQQQDRVIPLLALRIKSLEAPEAEGTVSVDDLLLQLREDLAAAESALEEARQAGVVQATKFLEQITADLAAKIAALEEET